jgi:hypothetical protein
MADTPTTPNAPHTPNGAPPPAPAREGRAAVVRAPSLRVTIALAALMLAVGTAVGAAIGPAPDASFAGSSRVPLLLPSLTALAVARSGGAANGASAAAVQPPPSTPQETPTAAGPPTSTPAPAPTTSAPTPAVPAPKSTTAPAGPEPSTPTSSTPKSKGPTLPPVTSVWLIKVSGATFTSALAQPAAAPYIDGQLIPAGTFLSGWSGLAGSAFASEAALLGGTPPQTLDSIVQPPCPEGAAHATCAPETPGALTAADEFLKQTIPVITASAAYRAHGLIVVTFASIGVASAAELPAAASTATLTAQPPAGVLLMSPFAKPGARPSAAFNAASPEQSLSGLMRK